MTLQTCTPMQTVPGTEGRTFTIRPGHIDAVAVELFTEGQCHALARALADATGWPMAVVARQDCGFATEACYEEEDIAPDLCECQLRHVVAVSPSGQYVDITGVYVPDPLENYLIVPMSDRIWRHVTTSPFWRAPALQVARTFVAPVLASVA
ncbi:hypothetical protein [Streptomyces californicus]|uniref:hypothetical protein n=1 Tax=Streptomyces californicus TaxID=67351 RepID=UPI00296E4606|nr:hypothetical protein [Streptomyces californicus]MDW4912486.1 hypothetical protein [Streptomyces californicus]